MIYKRSSTDEFLASAKRLAYDIAFRAGVVITNADEKFYAERYLEKYPRYGSEMPTRSRMMSVIAEDFAG